MLSGSASCSHPHPPRPQLQCVFDACDTTGSGLISLRQLANVSRSHVNGATQVLAILKSDIGPNGGATINVLLCLDRWSRSWTYLTLGKTGLRTTNSTSVSFTQRSVAVIENDQPFKSCACSNIHVYRFLLS